MLALLREWGVAVEERVLTVEELERAASAGKLEEMFGTGTAAVVAPIGVLGNGAREIVVGGGGEGRLTRRLYDAIRGIQFGTLEDRYGWLVPVPAR